MMVALVDGGQLKVLRVLLNIRQLCSGQTGLDRLAICKGCYL